MNPEDLEKSPENFATKDGDTFYACVVVGYLENLDYVIGPFVSDEAALMWVKSNKHTIGKGCSVTIQLQVKPGEEGDEDER